MKAESKVIAIYIVCALSVWLIDGVMDYCVFYQGTFHDLLFFAIPPHETYARTSATAIILICGVITSRLVARRRQECEQRLSERDKAGREKAALQEQLHQSHKMEAIGLLAGGVAHDFNNLLTVITCHVEWATSLLGNEHHVLEGLEQVKQAARQAAGLTRSLLTFSHRLPTQKEPVDLCRVVDNASRLLRRTLPANIRMTLDTGHGTPVWINADKTQLQQVIMNLAINARDAMPDGGTLTIQVSSSQGIPEQPTTGPDSRVSWGQLVVTDTGQGMLPEVQARIFDPFYTTKPRDEGTGLGLSIVHGIVQDHDGRILVQSEVGQGATFTILLPMLQQAPSPKRTSPIPSIPESKGETILLVEDNVPVLRLLTTGLRTLGYEVLQAADGDCMLEVHRKHADRIRLIVTDLELPRRSGMQALRTLRLSGVVAPAILITGNVDPGLEAQLDDRTRLLRKPFQIRDLGTLVAETLEPQMCLELRS